MSESKITLTGMAKKRRVDVPGEYPVKFATGEVLYLPDRHVKCKPLFVNGRLVKAEQHEKVRGELEEWTEELIKISTGVVLTGRPLELLFNISANLILQTYDADDEDLSRLLMLDVSTNEHNNIYGSWPDRIMRWIIGGDEAVEILANESRRHGRTTQSENIDGHGTGDVEPATIPR